MVFNVGMKYMHVKWILNDRVWQLILQWVNTDHYYYNARLFTIKSLKTYYLMNGIEIQVIL